MKLKKIQFFLYALVLLFLPAMQSFAQSAEVEMADSLREDGKIYVVIAVLLCIFAFLFIYLVTLEKKIRKMENEIKSS
ncbi:MAG: hypothetical protein NZ551_12180 [Microscillaceae bacterium]|nr:hypothetical protein [Microscillaceae bacterium]MDW8461953.1 hypothetical protein [Cytophagales bacterium]